MAQARHEMSANERETLKKNYIFILDNLTLSADIFGYLIQEDILSEDMADDIKTEKPSKERTRKLLGILPKRGPTAFKTFLDCLRQNHHKNVADALQDYFNQLASKEYSAPPKEEKKGVQVSGNEQKQPESDEVDSKVSKLQIVSKAMAEELMADPKNPVYPMRSKQRGRAVVINNQRFVGQATRVGAAVDAQNLQMLFEQLGFKFVLYSDLTAQEMRDTLKDESRHGDHKNADCFVCFVLSHGTQGFVLGMDGRECSIDEDIVAPFNAKDCPLLNGKPKMFFFQACQGADVAVGVLSSDDKFSDVSEAFNRLKILDTDAPMLRPAMADTVLAYSTVPGYVSWRDRGKGSIYVMAIMDVFMEHANEVDLGQLLTKVCARVEKLANDFYNNGFVQQPESRFRTAKRIFFFPGYYE